MKNYWLDKKKERTRQAQLYWDEFVIMMKIRKAIRCGTFLTRYKKKV